MGCMMKKYVVCLSIAVSALLSGCFEKADVKETGASGPLYRQHFVGMTQLLAGTNAAKVKEIWNLKSTPALRDEFLNKLAQAPHAFWSKQIPSSALDQKELIRPLFDDLLNSESYLDIKGPSTRPEGALAVRLSADRMKIWNDNLTKLASAWSVGNPETAQSGNAKGWTIKRQKDSGIIQIMQAGEWMLIGIGQEKLTLLPALLDQVAKTTRPIPGLTGNILLSLDADMPHLKNWFPVVTAAHMPPVHADLIGEGEYIRTKMTLRFSEPIPWKPEPWNLPTEIINDPICGLTVGQGIAPLLPGVKGVSALGLKNYPNQFCIWGEATEHFLSTISFPVPKAASVLKEITPKLPEFIKAYFPDAAGQIASISNRNEVLWQSLPMIIPFMKATNLHGTDYLVTGVLPVVRKTNTPPPPELFKQFMNRNDLMYYDWEITEQSLVHSRQYFQILDIVSNRNFPKNDAVITPWITEAGTHLGNAITEITRSSANELSLNRKSHLGLTGAEMVMLFRWLDSSTFPFAYEPPSKIGAGNLPRSTRTNTTNRAGATNAPRPALPAQPLAPGTR
jgi:hypothetical protein